MKVCVVLSGSIRLPQQSLEAITRWRRDHDVDVFIHTWDNVPDIHAGHWVLEKAEEPNYDIISKYTPRGFVIDDWEFAKNTFRLEADLYEVSLGSKIENISLLGMFFSMSRAWKIIGGISSYDVVVRMRFDGAVHDDIFKILPYQGWAIPEGSDFGGVNDRFGWIKIHGEGDCARYRSVVWADAYLGVYDKIEGLIKNGCEWCPEKLLAASLNNAASPITRVPLNYSILGFSS